MNRSSPRLVIFAALAVAGGVVWLLAANSPSRPTPTASAPAPGPARTIERSLPPMPEPPIEPVGEDEPDETAALLAAMEDVNAGVVDADAFRARVERTLALYRAESVNPPWSRPADGSMPHLLDWNRGTRIGPPFAADASGREVEGYLTLDRTFAGPGEAVTARVDVFHRADGGTTPAAPEKLTGRVEFYGGDEVGWQSAGELALVGAGASWEGRFTPSALPPLAAQPRTARVLVRLELGQFWKELAIPFRYAAQPALVVRGHAGDRVADGSLEVRYEVDVVHAAPTLVQAVLYDAAGTTALATATDWFRPSALGRQTMTVRFYGKVLRDRGISGPYRVRQLHGHVRVPDAEPEEVWWGHPDEPAVLTRPYRADEFTDQPYRSPEVDEAIARYEHLIETGEPTP